MIKLATSAIIQKDDKILIGLRKKDDFWEFPGGRIDPGETPEECILREIEEELAIEVKIEKYLGKLEGEYRDIPMEVHGFLTTWKKGEPQALVHEEIKWVSMDEIKNYDFIEEDLVIFKELL